MVMAAPHSNGGQHHANGSPQAHVEEKRVAEQLDPARRGKLSIAQRQELASKLLAYNSKDETFFEKLATKVREREHPRGAALPL